MKIKHKKRIGILMVAIVAVSLVFSSFNRDEKLFQIDKNLDIYYSLFRELNLFYVDSINPQKLIRTSIDDMLQTLDPYTNYIPESDMDDFNFMTTGEYAGIGAVIGKHGDHVIIADPYKGFPAQKAGLKAGDILLEIDGKSTSKMSTQDVSNALKGPANKTVSVKIQRPGVKKSLKIDIVRKKIQIDPIPYYGMLDDKTAYIRLTSFTANCGDEMRKIFTELKNQDGAQKLVLDLRGNPGGLLNEAIKIVNIFVPNGTKVVETRGKVKQWDQTYTTTEEPVDTVMPIAILVNRGSASASEIVTGSLQDLDRAVVIGTRTFGKGLVQTTRDLSYNAKLKVTTAKYYIPSGRCIQALDYTHRHKDGSVGTVPDSLISQFSTKDGRIVYDGGGIVPDIKVDPDSLSTLSFNLIQDYSIFDFATEYANTHKTIASPEEFKISDDIYNQFKTFLKDKKFSYESDTELMMKKLIETAKEEQYYSNAADEFKKLEKEVTPDLDTDLNRFKPEIKDLLRNEIVLRYYYQRGAIESTLKDDEGIKQAKKILSDSDAFHTIFKKGRVISMKTLDNNTAQILKEESVN